MQVTRLFTLLFLVGLILTTALSDSTWMDNDDNHAVFKRFMFGHRHHHDDRSGPRQCVSCRFGIGRCCAPSVCVKRRFRSDKCLHIKT
jgi:hypothetical protein